VLFSFGSTCFAQTHDVPPAEPKLPFHLKLIAANVWAAIDDAKGDAGANAGFVIGEDGVAVIDTFENEAAAKALLSEIHRLTTLPVRFVVNTHYHLDHVAGNRIFEQQGAVIVGHRRVRTWIHTENLKFFGDKIKPEQKSMVENLFAPEVTYDSGVTLFLGKRHLDVQFLPGHTGSDSVVILRDANIVFCGDLFWRQTLPNLVDAATSDWIPSLSTLAELSDEGGSADARTTTYVPGHGDVGNLADLEDFQNYLINLRFMLEKPVQDGLKGDALVAVVLPELTKQYGSWNLFNYFSHSNILDTGAELESAKRVPLDEKK
jgi:glyoxylase-like metal-dependent hydrolase (beta-lactamase superfamily II)